MDGLYKRANHAVKRLCISTDDRHFAVVLRELKNRNSAAHPGVRRTHIRLAQRCYWPRLELDVWEYAQSCGTCKRRKTSNLKKAINICDTGSRWVPRSGSMDFVTGLPVSRGFDAILTVVEKLSKKFRYAPMHSNTNAPNFASLCLCYCAPSRTPGGHNRWLWSKIDIKLLKVSYGCYMYQAINDDVPPRAIWRLDYNT